MSCNTIYQKSCIRCYDNENQDLNTVATPVSIDGVTVVDSGCSIQLQNQGFQIVKSGLYHISADVTVTAGSTSSASATSSSATTISSASSSNLVTVQLYKSNQALPCAIAKATVSGTDTIHVETDLYLVACCAQQPVITVNVNGATAVTNAITHVCAGCTKLA